MISVIIVAAGDGKRFESATPKQFIKINDKEIIDYSIEKFLNNNVDELIIVCHKDWTEHIRKKYPDSKIVIGGQTRSESVMKGLSELSNQSKKVLIHDAARPLINNETISMCLKELDSYDCVAPIIDIKESIISNNKETYKYINRNSIKIVQTPQCFKTAVINEIYHTYIDSTDEIGLALKSNKNYMVKFIPGSEKNIKVTKESDLEIVKLLLKNKESKH